MCAERLIPRHQYGFSIIELMVGMVVALLVGLAATSSALMFTASQRQGIGVGGVGVNANTALAALKNDAAAAGLGFFGSSRFLCSRLNFSLGSTVHWNGTAFSPVRITRVAGLDTIDVLQADRVEAGASVMLFAASTGGNATLRSFLPAQVHDAVLLSSISATDPCTVRSVTAVEADEDDRQRLVFDADSQHNGANFSINPTYSVNDQAASGVTMLGRLNWRRYRMDGTNLMLERPLEGTSAVVARNIIALRAQYGVSNVGSDSLAEWVNADEFPIDTDDNIARVRAIRVAVVTRSPQREKANVVSGACEASTDKPRIFVGTEGEDGVGEEVEPDVADWQCFRYRSALLVIPMRNVVLGLRAP